MKDMSLTADEAKEYKGNMVASSDDDAGPKYPYGLNIFLCDESLEKLGVTSLPNVGTKVNIMAVAVVSSVEQRQQQNGETETSLSLQITGMEMQMPTPDKNAAAKMWPDMDQD